MHPLIGLVLSLTYSVNAADWAVVDKGMDLAIISITFSDTKHGFLPFLDTGATGAKYTSDAGATWTVSNTTKFSSILMDAASAGSNGVIGGTFDTQYTTDYGKTFTVSKGDKIVGQSCETVFGKNDDKFFGIAGGDIVGRKGIAISTTAGASWNFFNASALLTTARYIAIPSRKVMYVAAGNWPQTITTDSSIVRHISSRIRIHNHNGVISRQLLMETPLRMPTDDAWQAQIVKTTDGGATWKSLFHQAGEFYFNKIDCSSETHCCAVGESDSPPRPGGRIWCTTDGTTFSETLFQSGATHSLTSMRAVSEQEWWAGGGNLDRKNFVGSLPHSTDGGKTWANVSLPNALITDLDFTDPSHGWASIIASNEQGGLAQYV
jgi:photosystem II stability/assembly factor-like uncharacterized protein